MPQISKPYQHPHRPSDANSHLWRHMREAHRHVVFGTLVVEHRLQPRLGRIERHAIPSPLNSIENILYELAHQALEKMFFLSAAAQRSQNSPGTCMKWRTASAGFLSVGSMPADCSDDCFVLPLPRAMVEVEE